MDRLRRLLGGMDGRSYKAYKALEGRYTFTDFELSIDHVQGDPFAAPSRISLLVPRAVSLLPADLLNTPVRRMAVADFLARAVASAISRFVQGRRGSGKSGLMAIETTGQQVLEGNALSFPDGYLEARMVVGLPADGRRILATEAEAMLCRELPQVVSHALMHASLDAGQLRGHVHSIEDQVHLQGWLAQNRLVAFVGEGALLPRASGVDDRPLAQGALGFKPPPSLTCRVDLPNAGPLSGMGVPAGVTLIVGGGFHGKSTLLHALERGVYPHIPGDGREFVSALESAVKVRAEDGRSVSRVNISPFIDQLPLGRDTHRFSTENASGSTSQAANILEALDCGTRLLLIDEDTSATNFMIRDLRMQALVSRDKEPITPLLHRVRELYQAHGISSVIVMGGSGDYFEVADTVIMMDTYEPRDVTAAARRLAGSSLPNQTSMPPLPDRPSNRRPCTEDLDPRLGSRAVKIEALDRMTLRYGRHDLDLSRVEQLVATPQTRAIGWLIHYYAEHHGNDPQGLTAGLEKCIHEVARHGLDIISPYKVGNLARPRLHELAAAINRMRGVRWTDGDSGAATG